MSRKMILAVSSGCSRTFNLGFRGAGVARILRNLGAAICLLLFGVSAASGQTVQVGTDASVTATYSTSTQSGGPFPWSDLGVTASASITPGVLNVSTGGATGFTLNSTVTGGESFVPGSTVLNVGYTPSWNGSFSSTPPANGSVGSQFVYNIGPINGSQNLLNVPLSISSAAGDLGSSLNNGTATSTSPTQTGPSVSQGFGVQAQTCFIECVTIASASLNFTVGTQVQQTITTAPTVTYGDLVWESTTPSYSSSDLVVPITGSAGNIQTPFLNPQVAVPGLADGQTFYYNMLPFVELDMPVTNSASVSLPASITASYDIFGVATGSQSFPLGNLYSLNTGDEDFDFNPTFYSNQFYSIPLEFSGCTGIVIVATCHDRYETPTLAEQLVGVLDGGPSNSGPCATNLIGCDLSVVAGAGSTTGYGVPDLGPLFPGDPSRGDICAPAGTAFAGDCVNNVSLTPDSGPAPTPEPSSITLFGIGVLALVMVKIRKLCT
jgi:hypothetical protein